MTAPKRRWLDRLEIIKRALRTDQPLSEAGRVAVGTDLERIVSARLRIEALIERHPQILDIELEPPIVITGLPRTGSSHLHNMLAATRDFSALPYWEAIDPGHTDAHMQKLVALRMLEARKHVYPEANKLHENTVGSIEEETALFALDMSGMFFETLGLGMLPSWRDHYLATDQRPHYRYLRRTLQALTWLRNSPKRWVLKSPQHMEQIPALLTAFPNASIVTLHRSLGDVVPSFLRLAEYHARPFGNPDHRELRRYWELRFRDMLRACRDNSHEALVITFDNFMAEPLRTLVSIYQYANLELSPAAFQRAAVYHEQHPRYRHGKPHATPILRRTPLTDILTP